MTPDDQREPGPLPSRWVLLARFGWPALTGTILLLVGITAIATDPGLGLAEASASVIILANLAWLVLFPLCAGWQAVVLMRRLPRRRRHAAILGLLPWSWAAFLATAACAAGIGVMAEVGIAWVTVEALR